MQENYEKRKKEKNELREWEDCKKCGLSGRLVDGCNSSVRIWLQGGDGTCGGPHREQKEHPVIAVTWGMRPAAAAEAVCRN